MEYKDNLVFTSGVPLESFLDNTTFRGLEVLCGKGGLKKRVRTITILDNLDFWQYIRGGELILSTGFLWKDNPMDLCDVIKGLNNCNATALCLKIGRFIDVLPGEVIETADKLSFPVLSYPMDFAFIDILNPALSMIMNTQAKDLKNSYYIHRTLTDLVVKGGGVQKIIEALHEITKLDVCFLDTHFKKRYYSGNSRSFLSDIGSRPLNELLSLYVYEKVQIDDVIYGFLLLNSLREVAKTHVIMRNALIHGSTVLKLAIQRKESDMFRERRRKDEFVFDLLYNRIVNEDELKERSTLVGWNSSDGVFVLVLRLYPVHANKDSSFFNEDFLFKYRDNVLLYLKNSISILTPDYCYTTLNHSIIFLIQSTRGKYEANVGGLRKLLSRALISMSSCSDIVMRVGVGGFREKLQDACKSYSEAEKSLTFFNSDHAEPIVFWDDLGIFKFFHDLDKDELENYFDNFLGKLVQYDNLHNSDLIETLDCLANHNWVYREAARYLSVHYNTVKYRVNLIESILSINIDNPETRLSLAFCLKLLRI